LDKDSRLYDWIALGLRIAICVAVVLLVVGVILCSIRGIEPASFVFSLRDAFGGGQAPLVIVAVGMLFLLFTPLLSIVLGSVAFACAKDRLYVAVSVAILGFVIGFVIAEI
jgi:uncharacterized membrane protein